MVSLATTSWTDVDAQTLKENNGRRYLSLEKRGDEAEILRVLNEPKNDEESSQSREDI